MKIKPPPYNIRSGLRLRSDIYYYLRELQARASEQAGRPVSMSWIVGAICEQFMLNDGDFRRARFKRRKA